MATKWTGDAYRLVFTELRDGKGNEIPGVHTMTATAAFDDVEVGDRIRFRATIALDVVAPRWASERSTTAHRLNIGRRLQFRLLRPSRLPLVQHDQQVAA